MRATGPVTLTLGLFLVSTAAPFLVVAQIDAAALVVLRMLGAALVFLAWGAAAGTLSLARPFLRELSWGALLLAAHFLLWLKAFDLTDYASNLLLLVAQPAIAALVGSRIGEQSSRTTWLSVAIALGGLALIARGDIALGPRALLGDALSILAGVAITFFYVVTRNARTALPLAPFMATTMLVGGLASIPVALAMGARFTGHSPASWGWVGALVLLTTVGGHGLMNVAARHVRLFTLNVVIVLEPAIGIALGSMLFDVSVTPLQVVGGAILGVAVVVGVLPELKLPPPRLQEIESR